MPHVLVLAPRGRDAAVITEVFAQIGVEAAPCRDLATLAVTLDEAMSAVVVTEEELTGPALDGLLTWVAGQPNWSDLPFLVLGTRTTRSAAHSALIESLGNAVLLERPLATEALITALRAALRARGRQLQVREEAAGREEAVRLLREMNQELERRVEARTAELSVSEARLRAYFESFPEALFVVRMGEQGGFYCESLNPKAERVLGKRQEQVVGRAPELFLPPVITEIAKIEFRRCVELGRTHTFAASFPFGSEVRLFEVTVTPMSDPSGRVYRLIGIARDVTQQRRLEDQLHRAQKLEALGQLTGGVAHDFNNLLQVVTSGLALLERSVWRPEDAARRARLITAMRHATARGADLVRRLLVFSRRQTLRPEPVALGPWLDANGRDLLSRTLRGDIVVHVRVEPNLPPVRADAAGLELALLNLALNARDAMPDGGELVIKARRVTHRPDRGADGPGEFVRLSVSDTGTGMTPDIIDRLFEPFFTTKEPGVGTGLGLAQVYGFARQSGGTVDVQSEPGRGTTVSITFPVAVDRVVETVTTVAPAIDRALSILVCEDDNVVAGVVCQLLDQLGHRTQRVANAEDALSALGERAPFDLLLTDVIMPGGMDGAALAREAVRRHPDLHVLLTTGYQGNADADGLPILRKPYGSEDLAAAIAAALARPPPRASERQGNAAPNMIRSPA